MIVLIQYSIQGDYPIVGITWRETSKALMERCRRSDGEIIARVLTDCTFGQMIGRSGLYSPRFGIAVASLHEALDLLGLPVDMAEEFPAVDIHHCWDCRLGVCRRE